MCIVFSILIIFLIYYDSGPLGRIIVNDKYVDIIGIFFCVFRNIYFVYLHNKCVLNVSLLF